MIINKYGIYILVVAFCMVFIKAPFTNAFNFLGKTGAKNFNITYYTPSAPILLNGVHDKVIDGLEIDSSGVNCIRLTNCSNITIQNCRLVSSKGNGVDIYKCKNITIKNCYMESIVTGVYAIESQGINVSYNQVKNVRGPFPRGQMVQFNEVSGKKNVVSYNRCENILGESYPEDIINMFKTNGTFDSPVLIEGNWIRGGGPSKSGGGIMLGDNGGSYIIAKDNILVNPGQYGMAIAGGTNIQIVNNKIYSKRQYFTNVGLYVWNQSPPTCALNTVSGNMVNWINAAGEANNSWNNGNCGMVNGWNTNILKARIDSTILPRIILAK